MVGIDHELDDGLLADARDDAARVLPVSRSDEDRVHLEAQCFLDLLGGAVQIVGVDLSHDEHVHVARQRTGLAVESPSPGSEDERLLNAMYASKRCLEQRRRAESLGEESGELGVDRRVQIRADDPSVADSQTCKQTCRLEPAGLSLHRRRICLELARQCGERLPLRGNQKQAREEGGLEPRTKQRKQGRRFRAYNALYLALDA